MASRKIDRPKLLLVIAAFILALGLGLKAFCTEAPTSMKRFNVICPARELLSVLDRAYHECDNGFDGSCEKFVATFQKLLPEYDCQRPFDATPTQNFIVPAIWLAGDGPLGDYVRLLADLAKSKGSKVSRLYSPEAIDAAQRLFGSKEFRQILDGELAEDYLKQSIAVERRLEQKHRRKGAE
ncbi:hypothetical protein [Candidatus Binatus sp.]|jgi:hypothetical protein|uniref:hypothetical protein n=1 Tax=Candidatus Binatus sp. TaxID=2811406 RepID=UPI003F97C4FA